MPGDSDLIEEAGGQISLNDNSIGFVMSADVGTPSVLCHGVFKLEIVGIHPGQGALATSVKSPTSEFTRDASDLLSLTKYECIQGGEGGGHAG